VTAFTQADSEAEMESWIDAVHLTCAASYARHLGRDGTAKLLRAEIHKLENSIDLVCLSVCPSVRLSVLAGFSVTEGIV